VRHHRGVSILALVLLIAGACLEAVGLVFAVVGFVKTWRDFSTGGRLFEKDIARLRAARQAAQRAAQRFGRRARRPQSAKIHAVTGTDSARAIDHARARVTFGPLPSPTNDTQAFVSELERRLNVVRLDVQHARERIYDESEARKAADREVSSELRALVAEVEHMSRSVAVGGLREQVIGWSCIAVGFVMQTASNVMQAVPS
jgi:hypothetical protein